MTYQDKLDYPIHFVGSIPLKNTEAVFRALASSVGMRAKRWPDGETGERAYWIRWQKRTFDEHLDFELKSASKSLHGYKDAVERPFYVVRDGVDPADIRIKTMGYAAEAIASYATFASLKADGIIPLGVRFQVSIPSAIALTAGFFEMPERAAVEPVIEAALAHEIQIIAAAIPHEDLAIQWDVCHEVVAADGGILMHYADVLITSTARIVRLLGFVPDGVEAGVHLCYGDPGHKHIVEPADLGTCVAYANGIAAAADREVNFIHMPVPRDRRDAAYFSPLGALDLPVETELYLGLVHYTDGAAGTAARLIAASGYVSSFGVATECGLGRRDPETILPLLDIHAAVAG